MQVRDIVLRDRLVAYWDKITVKNKAKMSGTTQS